MDANIAKDILLYTSSLVSVVAFGMKGVTKYKHLWVLPTLCVIAFKSQYSFFSNAANYQISMFLVGITLLMQFYSKAKLENINLIKTVLGITGILQSAFITCQIIGVDVYPKIYSIFGYELTRYNQTNGKWAVVPTSDLVTGSLANPTYSASLIAITLPFLFRKKLIWAAPWAYYCIFRTHSTLCILASVICAIIYLIEKFNWKKKIIYSLIVASIIAMAVISKDKPDADSFLDNNGRYLVWKNSTLVTLKNKPLLGFGFGRFYDHYHQWFGSLHKERFRQMHNEYMEIFFALGIVGSILTMWFLWLLIKDPLDPHIFSSLISLLFISGGHFTFHVSTTALVGILVMALSLKFKKHSQGEANGIFSNG